MSKVLNITLLVLMTAFSSLGFAQKMINLSPKESKSLTNTALWTVKATCTVQSPSQGKVLVSVVKNHGTVNGRSLGSGQATSIKINHNTNIAVSAEPGTQVNISNLSGTPIAAACSV